MKELIESYSLTEIIMFVFMVAIAGKEILGLGDWWNDRISKKYKNKNKAEKVQEEIQSEREDIKQLNEQMDKLSGLVEMLIESDKENIKSYITTQHHYLCYEKGWVDDYTLNCLEKRFNIYEKEHGNSFIEGFMNEIRELPKRPPDYSCS